MFKKKEECNKEIKEIKELLLKDLANINRKLNLRTNNVKTKFNDLYTGTPDNKISNIPKIIELLSVSDKDIYDEIKIFLDAMETNYYDYKVKEKECELLGKLKEHNIEYDVMKDYIQEYIEKSNDIKDLINEYSNSKNNIIKESKKERIEKLINELLDILNNIIKIDNLSKILLSIFLIIYEITLFEDTILKGENTLGNIKDTITGLNESILSLLKDDNRTSSKDSQKKQIEVNKKRQLLEKEKKSLEDKKGKLELDLQKYIQKNPIDDTIQKKIDRLSSDIENIDKEIVKKSEQSNILNSDLSQKRKKNQLDVEIKDLKKKKERFNNEIFDLEIKFDQANRLKIQTQKNQYERPIKLLEIDIDSKDKSIKDIDEQSKKSGQSDMTPISNSEKDYFNYVINFIDVYISGKDSKNIIQRMFEKDAIVKIYNMKSPSDQIKELKKIPFFKKQDESFFNFFQRGGANSLPEPFTETVKKYMLDSKKVNTFYVDAYFNYLTKVNKEFNIYIQQLFLRLDSAMKTEVDHTNDLCKKLKDTNDKLDIIIKKIKDSSSSSSINNSDYTKNLYPYTDFILAYFMILVYFVNRLIMKILGCSDSKGSSGGGETNDNNKLDINEVYYNGIKIYVRKANKSSILGMIERISNQSKNKTIEKHSTTSSTPNSTSSTPSSTTISTTSSTPSSTTISTTSSTTSSSTESTENQSENKLSELELSIRKGKIKNKIKNEIKNKIKLSNYNNNAKNPLYKIVNNLNVEQLNELSKIENSKELINKIKRNNPNKYLFNVFG